jgi:4-hydroxybenzoate polyprenyltransferase
MVFSVCLSAFKMFKVFFQYLLNRFQLIPLSLLVLSDVLVIVHIAETKETAWLQGIAVFLFVMLYLLNNRVADDKRDFEFDNKHHQNRALQSGKLSLKFLNRIGYICLTSMLALSFFFGKTAMLAITPVVLFAYWSKLDFSLPKSFKEQHFFLYNFMNMWQMLLLQSFMYFSLMNIFTLKPIMWLHIGFVFLLSLQVEVTRKIQPEKTPAFDTYSDRLGMRGALLLWGVLGIIALTLFSILASELSISGFTINIALICCVALLSLGGGAYYFLKSKSAEGLFWLTVIMTYIGQNLVMIYG